MVPGPSALQSAPGVSHPCKRCGRAAEPTLIICGSCRLAQAGPASLVTRATTPPKAHHRPPLPPSPAVCAACRSTLRVPPSHRHTAHTLCPPCQARAGHTVDRNHGWNTHARANPYPVVLPAGVPKATWVPATVPSHVSTVAFTYPRCAAPPERAMPPPRTHRPEHGEDVGADTGAPRMCTHLPPHLSGDTCDACMRGTLVRPLPSQKETGDAGAATDHVRRHEDVLRVCMRFGCRARLPPHIPGDMCDTCTCAGFVRPLPAAPPVVPKRVPRRAADRTSVTCDRPREPLDVVRASLFREPAQAQGASPMMETRDVEDEGEVELVYPDDIPVETQCAPTTSGSKSDEPIPMEDEDAELELVYPEDVVGAVRASTSRPHTTPVQPTTLRELFQGSLQAIPALQDHAVLGPVETNPPRHCRMAGCNEVLPAQTTMERCVQCSAKDWKRRKLSAMATLEPSRRYSASPQITTTAMKEKEVVAVLDEMSDIEESAPSPPSSFPSSDNKLTRDQDVEGGNAPSPPSSSPSKGGSDGVSRIPGWDSDLTELSSSNSDTESTESISDSDTEPDLETSKPDMDTTGLKIRVPLLVTRLPPDTTFQKCSNKRCNIALPRNCRWKTCDPCRGAQRIHQRLRIENARRSALGIEPFKLSDLSGRRHWRSLSPEMSGPDTTLTPETSRPCSAMGCRARIPLLEVYRWKTCIGCRALARRKARRKRDALLETQSAPCQPEIVPRFAAHQNRSALLSSFEAQLRGFVEGQIMYLRAKLYVGISEGDGPGKDAQWKPENTQMMFVFAGEYSIVSGQRSDDGANNYGGDQPMSSNNPRDLEAMRQEVSRIVAELERVLRAKLRAGEAFSIDKGGILMRFTCSLELIAQLRPLSTPAVASPSSAPDSEVNDNANGEGTSSMPPPPPNPPAIPLVKTFSGELEAVVVPDESHHLFHGRRMVVRYRMIG